MKSELKVEFCDKSALAELIEKAYFQEGYKGKLLSNKNYIEVTIKNDDILHTIIKGLNNAVIKLSNPDIIDGTCKFIVDDTNENPRIYPISMYCIKDDSSKFIFY